MKFAKRDRQGFFYTTNPEKAVDELVEERNKKIDELNLKKEKIKQKAKKLNSRCPGQAKILEREFAK